MLSKLSPYLIAMVIGLIVGIERERRNLKGTQAMGVRSFLLLSLIGALAGGINQPLISLGLVIFAASATLIGYLRTTRYIHNAENAVGLTSEIAAMTTFALGYLANSEPFLSLALALVMFFVLQNKTFLHTLIRKRLNAEELQAAAILLLLAVGVIPIIPDKTVDYFNIFNPRRLALIIAFIAGMQFAGYAISRMFGHRIGMPLSGFLSGLASSTAAFLSYSQLAKDRPANYLSVGSAATLAATATLCQLAVVVALISWPLAIALVIPVGSLILAGIVVGFVLVFRNGVRVNQEIIRNPLNIRSAIKLGALLTALVFLVELTERFLGPAFTVIVTFLAALFELQGVTAANASMFANGTITMVNAATTILVAIFASLVSKVAITIFFARGTYRKLMLSITGGFLLLTVCFWFLIKFVPAMLIAS